MIPYAGKNVSYVEAEKLKRCDFNQHLTDYKSKVDLQLHTIFYVIF